MIQGLSFSVFMLGIPPDAGQGLFGPRALTLLAEAATRSKAICMSAGECIGIDVSIGASFGYALPDKRRESFDQLQNKEYAQKYETAKKTVTDTVMDKLRDWSPF